MGGSGGAPAAAPMIEPVKQVGTAESGARDNTMRRLLRRFSLARTNVTKGELTPGATTQRKSLLGQ